MTKLQKDMYQLFVSGLTLDEIASDFGVSVEEVYQAIRWLRNM